MSGRPLSSRRTSSYLTAPRPQYSYGGSSSNNSGVDDYGWTEPPSRLFSRPVTPQPEDRSMPGSPSLVPTIRRRSSSSVSSIRTAASDATADDAPQARILEFAKQKNPTLSVRLSRRLTWECTYAELLQYASALLSARRIARLWWPPASRIATWQGQESAGGADETVTIPTTLLVTNVSIVIIALATLDMRRNGEKLGLRRTWLMLCAALFVMSCLAAVWPAASSTSTEAMTAKTAADSVKHGIDDFERAVAARIAAWRTHGNAHVAVGDTPRFQIPHWPTDAALDSTPGSILRQAQVCAVSAHGLSQHIGECKDVSMDDSVHHAAGGMIGSSDSNEPDHVSRICAQMPAGQSNMLRLQLHSRHTVMIMCDHGQ